MSQSETLMLIVLGFAVAAFLALIIGRLAWKLALRIGAKRAMRNVPSTVSELQTDRDRLRADHAMMAKKLELRVDEMKMRAAEQAAEVARHRNRFETLVKEIAIRDAKIADDAREIATLHEVISGLKVSLNDREKEIAGFTKVPELVPTLDPTQDRLQSRINELTSLSDEISKQREAAPIEVPPVTNGILVKPADSTSFKAEILETKIVAAEQAANHLQDELKRLEEVWPEADAPAPAPEKPTEEPPKRGITNVISLAKRIKALQKTIVN
jgi:chromosome segregation ATPase